MKLFVTSSCLYKKKIKYVVCLFLLNLLSLAFSNFIFAQDKTVISGTVYDEDNTPLPSVNIIVVGTSNGTQTDFDGNYELEVENGQNLKFSSIGFQDQTITVDDDTTIDIILKEGSELDEVVVVGYGVKKKKNLTGSVETVESEDIDKRTVSSSSLALQGQMSGLSIRQSSGNPVNDEGSPLIRGRGTFSDAGTSPLVLVDGIESSLNAVDPFDITNVTVLKDAASASIYGSKAANGVILIETKSGQREKLTVNYDSYVAKLEPTFLPRMVNSWEYAEVVNSFNPGTYSDSDIEKFKSGIDPEFPNVDHINNLFKSGPGLETKQNLSVAGGNENAKYRFSFGYNNKESFVKKNNSDKFNVRMNLEGNINKRIKFTANMGGSTGKSREPSSPDAGLGGIVLGAMRNSNLIPGETPDGFWGRKEIMHPEADLNSKSFNKDENRSFLGNGKIEIDVVDDLKITGQVGYDFGKSRNLAFRAKYPVTPDYAIDENSLSDSWSENNSWTIRALLDYDKNIQNHSFHFLGGLEQKSDGFKNVSAFRDKFPNNEIHVIDVGAVDNGQQGGNATKNTLASFFGRLNYEYNGKYLLEANLRYDGSSRFPSDNRWGSFPSFSAGWVISEEPFFKDALPWIGQLKIRGSWGELGNQSIGDYPYQNLLESQKNYPFGDKMASGVAITQLPNKEIKWETTKITDVGLDFSILNNKLNLSVDYFDKSTSNILFEPTVSSLLGANPSEKNGGKVGNKGWESDVSYQNHNGDFKYGLSANFSIVHNEVLELTDVSRDIGRGLFIGHPIGSSYGYVSDGLFVDEEEVSDYPEQPFSNIAEPGGIKLVDLDGPDGEPDGKVDPSYDRRVIGQPLPITTYALTFNAEYKGFDLNVFFQGEGGRRAPVTIGQSFYPLENESNIQRIFLKNSWTEENPNPDAEFPKIKPTATGFYDSNPIDFWYRNATFLRLKNVQIGYDLTNSLIKGSFFERLRIYFSGENLFTLTGYYKGWDPEMTTGSSETFYPLVRTYSAGLNITF